MEVRTREPYWLLRNGYSRDFPCLTERLTVEVCIIGGGITGALAALALVEKGLQVAVIDKRHPGLGSTAASTALLQYEIDEPLYRLIKDVGRERGEQSYMACYRAIESIQEIARQHAPGIAFTSLPSLQYASKKSHEKRLVREFEARKRIGLDVQLITQSDIKQRYDFDAPMGLWSAQAAQLDPYQLTHAILTSKHDGLTVYDTCDAVALEESKKGVTVKLHDGNHISAGHVVVACGYEADRFLPRPVAEMTTTYAFVTKPLPPAQVWSDRTLIWETKSPYLYVRTTDDLRVIGGGRDSDDNEARKRKKSLPEKTQKLMEDIRSLWPDKNLALDFSWAGAFGKTRDSLPYIGCLPDSRRIHYILGYGGNGITFSQTGAEIIRDAILGIHNPLHNLYSFER